MKPEESRLLFLKQFTKEIILQSKPVEKPADFSGREKIWEMMPPEIPKISVPIPVAPKTIPTTPPPPTAPLIKPSVIEPSAVPTRMRYALKPVLPAGFIPSIIKQASAQIKPAFAQPTPPTFAKPTQPIPQPVRYPVRKIYPALKIETAITGSFAGNFDLGKISFLIKDPKVTVIECPGPDKFLLARALGKTAMTRVTLTQEEIQDIINKFSEKAKIPVISGLFKAAVENLIITAVISELVGNRFIITKITPSYMLEQQTSMRIPSY